MARHPRNNVPGTSNGTTSKHSAPAQAAPDDTFDQFLVEMTDTAPQKDCSQTAKLLRQIVDPLHQSTSSKSNLKTVEIAKYVKDWMNSNDIPKSLFAEKVAYWEVSKLCWNLRNAHSKRVGMKIFGVLANFCDLPDNAKKRIAKLLRDLKEEQDYKKEMDKEKKSKTTLEQHEEALLMEFRRKMRDASSMEMDDEPADLEAAETLRQLGRPDRSLDSMPNDQHYMEDPMELDEPDYQEEVQMPRGVSESDDDVVVLGEVINNVWMSQEEMEQRQIFRRHSMNLEEVPRKKFQPMSQEEKEQRQMFKRLWMDDLMNREEVSNKKFKPLPSHQNAQQETENHSRTVQRLRETVDSLHDPSIHPTTLSREQIVRNLNDWMDTNGIHNALFAEYVLRCTQRYFSDIINYRKQCTRLFNVIARFVDLPDDEKRKYAVLMNRAQFEEWRKKRQEKQKMEDERHMMRIQERMKEQNDHEKARMERELLRRAQNVLKLFLDPNSTPLPDDYNPDKTGISQRLMGWGTNTNLGAELFKHGVDLFENLFDSTREKSEDQLTLGEKTSFWKIQKLLDFVEKENK